MNNGAFADHVNNRRPTCSTPCRPFPSEAGALIRPLAVGMRGEEAGSLLGQNVVVVGAGTIDLCTIMCARRWRWHR